MTREHPTIVSIRLRSVGPEKCREDALEIAAYLFQSVSGLWDRRNPGGRRVRLRAPFQSVSGLWDRRNADARGRQRVHRVSIRLRSVGPEKSVSTRWGNSTTSFNPSPVCGTGEMWGVTYEPALQEFQSVSGLWDRRNQCGVAAQHRRRVSIRLRSVGPEKWARPRTARSFVRFQSVSGLWDRRNCSSPPTDGRRGSFNPSPVCGTGEMRGASMQLENIKFQSVSGLWDRRNAARPRRCGGGRRFNPSPVCGTGEMSAWSDWST